MTGMDREILRVEAIHTYYGKSHILQGISFEVRAHECVSLLGRNGAGKTTTLRSLMGLVPPRQGQITFAGQPIQGRQPFEISRLGMGYVPEDRQIFGTLTVLENLNLSIQKHRRHGPWELGKIMDVFPSLAQRKSNRGNQLSGGEQQMLAIARALMSNPDMLLLDEPTEGLAPLIVQNLLAIIKALKEAGLTIVLVEQDIEATREVADRYYVLQEGRIMYSGTNDEFWSHPEVKEKYLGV